MNRAIARALHESTNATFWMENPKWSAGNAVSDFALSALRKLPFSMHDTQKKLLFKDSDAVTVSGESVVVADANEVKKYMFRYPHAMPLGEFHVRANHEVETLTQALSSVALSTIVSIDSADIFKRPFGAVDAVTQTQTKLNLIENPPLTIEDLQASPTEQYDLTANDLERMLTDIQGLVANDALYPDIALSSGNLRRNIHDGSVTLIDVLPIHADGTRLIGDSPSKLPHNLDMLQTIEGFVGRYGQ